MIDDIFEAIIDYIKQDIGMEKEEIEARAEDRLKNELKRNFRYIQYFTKDQSENLQEAILELKKIREIYQKGKIFVRNQTIGKKKGLLSRWYDIHKMSNDPEFSKKHLDFIKDCYSERTYYRHKKKLKELGLIS